MVSVTGNAFSQPRAQIAQRKVQMCNCSSSELQRPRLCSLGTPCAHPLKAFFEVHGNLPIEAQGL